MRIIAVCAVCFCATTAQAQSQWNHNGSVVTLIAKAASRQFVYAKPRPGLPVSSGTLLFTGKRTGNKYSGSAYVFSSKCGPLAYPVNGEVSADERNVTLFGVAPLPDDLCKIVDADSTSQRIEI
jgi:hypothetical protein